MAKGLGNGFKDLGKKLGQILPGMVGAIVSFLFKTAGEAIGFLAKHAWLLILLVVTFVVEQFKEQEEIIVCTKPTSCLKLTPTGVGRTSLE